MTPTPEYIPAHIEQWILVALSALGWFLFVLAAGKLWRRNINASVAEKAMLRLAQEASNAPHGVVLHMDDLPPHMGRCVTIRSFGHGKNHTTLTGRGTGSNWTAAVHMALVALDKSHMQYLDSDYTRTIDPDMDVTLKPGPAELPEPTESLDLSPCDVPLPPTPTPPSDRQDLLERLLDEALHELYSSSDASRHLLASDHCSSPLTPTKGYMKITFNVPASALKEALDAGDDELEFDVDGYDVDDGDDGCDCGCQAQVNTERKGFAPVAQTQRKGFGPSTGQPAPRVEYKGFGRY